MYENGERQPVELLLETAGSASRTTAGFVWIGLQQASANEIGAVAAEFDLPALAVEDAIKAHQRPKLEVYDDVVFVVLKPVRYIDHDEIVDVAEIAMFIGPTFVITVRHGESDVLRRVRQEFDGDSAITAFSPSAVLYRAADLVVDGYEESVALISEDIDEIELQVFGDDQHGHAERIYKLKREITEFRRAVVPLAQPVERLAENKVPGMDAAATHYFRDVHDHLMRAAESIESHDRLLTDILQADLARLGARQSEIAVRQNEDMRKISAWAAIALLPTAVAGIYGMNFRHMPELEYRYGYFVVLSGIVFACAMLYRSFRRNGWL